jgi:prepilin-type N-terminal cleavage/methylation domain-containing protein
MRPTGRKWIGPKQRLRNISGRRRIAKRCGRIRRSLAWRKSTWAIASFDLSRRDVRTQPGVLTPGSGSKNNPPQRGGRVDAERPDLLTEGNFRTKIYRPFPPSSLIPELRRTGRAMPDVDLSPGLKPRAESYHPFGIKGSAYRNAGLTLIELLVVLTIIAAISALITTSVLSALNQQNQRVCLNNMLTIEAAKDEYIRDHPGATSIDKIAFQQYFRFGIPTCPDQPGVEYANLYSLTQTVTCSKHPQNDSKVSASPSPR